MNKAGPHKKERMPQGVLSGKLEDAADRLLLIALLCCVCVFVLYPVFCILLRSLSSEQGVTLSMYAEVWRNYRTSLRNSVFVAAISSVLCTAFSVSAALAISTQRGRLRTLCMGLLLMAMVSPPFISSLAYIQLYGRRGWISYRLLGFSWNPYNCWGVIWMQSISFVPLSALMLIGILSRIDRSSLDSARDLGAGSADRLRNVILPELGPGLLVSLLLCFVRSLADFGTPIIIGGRFSTLAADIYLQLTGYSNLEKASAMNMLLMLPSIAALFIYRPLMKRLGQGADSRTGQAELGIKLGRCGAAGLAAIALSLLYFIMAGLQYICIFASAFVKRTKAGAVITAEYVQRLWRYDSVTMLRSVGYGLFVALVGTLFAMLFAYYMDRRRVLGRGFFDCAAMLPYMLPGTCFGIGYILAFNHAPLRLTGTAAIVILNMLFRQLPTSTKICSATLSQLSAAQENAARDLGAGRIAVLRDVILPGLSPAFISCFAYNFSSSMTTAGAILFLIDPGRKLAVFKLFDAVYTGDYGLASVIASLIIVIVVAVEGLAFILTRRGSGANVSGA